MGIKAPKDKVMCSTCFKKAHPTTEVYNLVHLFGIGHLIKLKCEVCKVICNSYCHKKTECELKIEKQEVTDTKNREKRRRIAEKRAMKLTKKELIEYINLRGLEDLVS